MLDALETRRGATTSSSTGSRSSATTAAISMSGSSGTGSIRPFRSRAKCCATRMARSSPRPRCAMRGDADDWQSAEVRTGAAHLPEPPKRASFGSPFRYGEQARIFVVKDVNRREIDQIAAAYRELFLAAGGGALGLFTAVRTLRAVESRIAAPLARSGHHALCAACRQARYRRAGRSFPRRGERLPARHRCVARRRRCAGPLAASRRVRQGAVAEAHDPAQGAARALRQKL